MNPQAEFWNRLNDVGAGMLGLLADKDLMPIAPSLREKHDGFIWFIVTQTNAMVTGVTFAPQSGLFVVADSKSGLYASLIGELSLLDCPDIIEELWSPVTAGWVQDRSNREALRLLRFAPRSGNAWFNTTQGLKFLYDIEQENRLAGVSNGGAVKLVFKKPK
ncbi:General stress protein 26 [Cognatiyoonia koreensis]|uniref:General stress protein 26 n=1 Tax=Cognatiyoonia koreensis TaxID=364200 RepID=A0A1I0QUE6_9RHOB|nr:pyridoxamine 5'-phosphate oxidase family protein [Cognatiyoonia koreensis]SEW31052.1 General stress protein 26 [Cognatiyoonia koreensis]